MDTRIKKIDKNSHYFYVSGISESEFLEIKEVAKSGCAKCEDFTIGPYLFNFEKIGVFVGFVVDAYQFVIDEDGQGYTVIKLVDDVFSI